MLATTHGTLSDTPVEFSDGAACCVVLASDGYPAKYQTGYPITLPEKCDAEIYVAGAKLVDGRLVTGGGRVLGVTATADDLPTAIERAYAAAGSVHFENAYKRSDIGQRALSALNASK